MLISTGKRFIFVANTKTASTSIEHVLSRHADYRHEGSSQRKHIPLCEIEAAVPQLFAEAGNSLESYFCFGVMREPVEWIRSWFRYRSGNKVESPLPASMTFADFWKKRDWNIQRSNGRVYQQSDMFNDRKGATITDVIIPYDRMDEYAAQIFGLLGVNYSLPKKNVSVIREDNDPLDPGLIAEMHEHYKTDYALYDRLDSINAVGMEKLRHMATK